MRKKGIRRGLIERVEEILRETKSRVRIGGEVEESFWMRKWVRMPIKLDFI